MHQSSQKPAQLRNQGAVNKQAYHLIFSLQPEHFRELAAFSAWQLCIGCRHQGAARELLLHDAADLLHDAFESVLCGLSHSSTGRHPQARDVKSLGTFLRYLRSVIRSVRHKQAASAALHAKTMTAHPGEVELDTATQTSADTDIEQRDLKQAFFEAMLGELDDPQKYAAALKKWQEDFFNIERLSDLGLKPKDAAKLRAKAQRLYRRLLKPAQLPVLHEPQDL